MIKPNNILILFTSIVTGLVMTTYVYYKTTGLPIGEDGVNQQASLCSGLSSGNFEDFNSEEVPVDLNTTEITIIGGAPITGHQAVQVPGGCGVEIDLSHKKELIIDQIKGTWQFTANWAIWSLAIFFVLFVAKRTYANTRH